MLFLRNQPQDNYCDKGNSADYPVEYHLPVELVVVLFALIIFFSHKYLRGVVVVIIIYILALLSLFVKFKRVWKGFWNEISYR